MKMTCFQKIFVCLLIFTTLAGLNLSAQQRGGGGGGGGGGFGGFGGFGGGGGNNFNRGATPSSSSSQYNNNGNVGSAVISVDPVTHNIMVIADKQTSEQIRRVIESLDAPEAQVLIKVVFMEVQRNDDLDIGVEGGWTKGIGDNLTGSAGNAFGLAGANSVVTNFNAMGQPMAAALSPNSGSPNGFYQIVGKDFQATLKAIAVAGKAQVLSRPSILARDGQMAEIVVGQSVYLPSGVSFASVGNTSSTIPTINGSYQNVGIQLDVTPFIGANSLIQMILQPQITSIDNSSPGQVIEGGSLISSAVYAPNINKRSANTVVVTPDGQPVVIGGLISGTKSSSDSKVPLLGDIPLLGQLFKSSSKSAKKTELLMFLTPHIVSLPGQLPALALKETTQSQLITNSISEQDLDRFLERIPVKKNSGVK